MTDEVTQFAFVLVRHHSWEGDNIIGVYLNVDLAVAERDRLNRGELPDVLEPEYAGGNPHSVVMGDQSLLDYRVYAYPVNPSEVKA